MKKLLLLILVACLATVASAATFQLTLTVAQVSAIQFAYSTANDKGTYLDVQSWFANQVSGLIAGYATQQAQANASAFCVKFVGLTVPNRDAICASLGLSAGCSCQ